MNEATPWVDPELLAAGALLQRNGLVAPDRTQAPLSEVRARARPDRRISRRRLGAARSVSAISRCRVRTARCRAASTCPTTPSGRRCWSTPMAAASCRGACPRGMRCCASWCAARAWPLSRSTTSSRPSIGSPRRSRRWSRSPGSPRARPGLGIDPFPARGRRQFGRRQSGARRGHRIARRGGPRAALHAADLRCLFGRQREPVMAALRSGRRSVADPDAVDLGDLSRNAGAAGDWRAAPILGRLAGLPPAHLIVGSLDPLQDDSQRLTAAL